MIIWKTNRAWQSAELLARENRQAITQMLQQLGSKVGTLMKDNTGKQKSDLKQMAGRVDNKIDHTKIKVMDASEASLIHPE